MDSAMAKDETSRGNKRRKMTPGDPDGGEKVSVSY